MTPQQQNRGKFNEAMLTSYFDHISPIRIFYETQAVILAVCCSAIMIGQPAIVHGQQNEKKDPVVSAASLIEAGNFERAVYVLRDYLRNRTDDSNALRMLARTLYWTGDVGAACTRYEEAISQHPNDVYLRLEYARMLVETGNVKIAFRLLAPLEDIEGTASEAKALVGTILYWRGDWNGAKKHFKEALRLNPEHTEAKRQLDEIRIATSPRVSLFSDYQNDDQPLKRRSISAELMWHATPLWLLTLRAQPQQVIVNDSTRSIAVLNLASKHNWPHLHLESEVSAGLLHRSFSRQADWTWRMALSLRLPRGIRLIGRGQRAPYLHTKTSLTIPIMTNSVAAIFHRSDPKGWIGEAGYELIYYPDENRSLKSHAWLLMPLYSVTPIHMRLGYGYNFQNSQENRFVLASDEQRLPARRISQKFTGQYSPYYTAKNQHTHNILGSIVLEFTKSVGLQLNGSFGFYAAEDAPFFYLTTGTPQLQNVERGYYKRRFHPWKVQGTLNASLSTDLTLSVEAEYLRAAYYESKNIRLKFAYRLLSHGVEY
jgi:Flp pilus assembly protein TadD